MNFQPANRQLPTANCQPPTAKIILLPLLLLLPMFFQAQVAMKYVPGETPMLLTLNLGNLDKKVNLAQLQQYDFYNEMVKQYSLLGGDSMQQAYYQEFLRSPESLGYDVLEPLHFFVNKDGNYTYFTSVIKLANRAKYEERLQNLKLDAYPTNLKSKDGYLIWQDEKDTYAWNDEVVINVWSEYSPPPFDWSQLEPVDTDGEIVFDPSLEGEEPGDPSDEEEEDSIVFVPPVVVSEDPDAWQQVETQAAVAAWVEKIMRRQFSQVMTANERFRSAAAQPADVHFWLDYDFVTQEMNSTYSQMAAMGMGAMGEMQAFMGFYEMLLKDSYLSMRLNFENGKMALTQEMFVSEDLKKLYQRMFKAKFNKKFLRYVEGGDQLFGYAFFNFNVKNTIDEGKALAHKMLNSMPGYGQMIDDAVKIAGIFIDEKAIGNLLKGDLLLAVSGMQTRMVRETSYDLDENFNVVPKDTIVARTLPVFTAMASYGSATDIQKFIDLGLHSQVLQPDGRFYKFTLPDSSMDIYLAMQKGILLLTNDRNLVQNRLDAGVKTRLSKKHRKLLCQSSAALYWDIPNTLRAVGSGAPDSNVGFEGYLNMMAKEFESLQATSPKKVENSVKSETSFNFVKKDVNALEAFFRFVNDIYVETIGGAKT